MLNEIKSESKNHIKTLPKEIANRIAAGEVVERPASVLKELIENAIDAKAKTISVCAIEGGCAYLSVSDDGEGIAMEELPLALTHHATSKISSIEDLLNISTLGFRGEALASVSDVSHFEIISRQNEKEAGILRVEGGEIKEHGITSASLGTKISVKNLFYNLPARKKFLKHPSKELIALKEIIEANAIKHHNVTFRFEHNEKKVYNFPARDTIKERLMDFLGKEHTKSLISINANGEFFEIEGLVSNIDLHQATSKRSFLFVNGRHIDNKSIAFAIRNAYYGVIPKDRFPYFYIFITINPEELDVNVHPSKKEVKIKGERIISSAIYHAVKNVFENSSFRSVAIETDKNERTLSVKEKISEESFSFTEEYVKNIENVSKTEEKTSYENNNDIYKENEDRSKGNLRVLGQSFFSYIIAEYEGELLIIDQHAAYERLNFEKIKKKVLNEEIEYETLLIPIELEYSKSETERLKNAKKDLKKLGIEFELMGEDLIVIEKLPLYFQKQKSESLVKDLLDNYLSYEKDFRFDKFLDNLIEGIACKLSPKAGESLSQSDMQNLLLELKKENVLSSCPHGRPFILRLEKEYIDKKFFR